MGSPVANPFANLSWILNEQTDLSVRSRAEAIERWLTTPELDRWRSPVQSSQAGESTMTGYDFRRSAAERLRKAAERFVAAAAGAGHHPAARPVLPASRPDDGG